MSARAVARGPVERPRLARHAVTRAARAQAALAAVAWAAIAAVAGAGCDGGADEAPEARILDATPETLTPSVDALNDLTLRIAYRDGDGDLGGGRVRVHDCRAAGVTAVEPIPPIATEAAVREGASIEGELVVTVADVGALAASAEGAPACAPYGVPPLGEGTATFCVELEDAAGRTGPGDCTGPIALRE